MQPDPGGVDPPPVVDDYQRVGELVDGDGGQAQADDGGDLGRVDPQVNTLMGNGRGGHRDQAGHSQGDLGDDRRRVEQVPGPLAVGGADQPVGAVPVHIERGGAGRDPPCSGCGRRCGRWGTCQSPSCSPDPARPQLLARVTLGAAEPITARERQLPEALPHRHTHRGPWAPGPLPSGLAAGFQHDALAEGAQLALVDRVIAYQKLADITGAAGPRQDRDPVARKEIQRWSRSAAEPAPDGVPAHAFPATADHQPGRLPQRDFDLGRGLGLLPGGGPPPAASAVLLTTGDGRADWLRAGQALHRLLAHAATKWVFASLHTQPLEAAPIRALIRDRLALPRRPKRCSKIDAVTS